MRVFLIGIIVALVTLFVPLAVFAQQKNTQPVVLPKNEVINHDYFATGSSVDIEGTVNGDVYAAGGSVLVNGTVNGDILAAGGQVTVRGTARNVRVAGGQILLDGTINGNSTAVGGNITTASTATLSGSLVGAGGQFNLLGPVGKTLSLAGGQVSVGNSVGGDAWIQAQTITLTPQAHVNGNLSYVSAQKATIENGAVVNGRVSQTYPPQPQRQRPTPTGIFAALAEIKIAFSIVSFLVSLVIGLLLISLTPVYVERVIEHISHHPWQSLLIGFITWILTPFIVILLLLTLIGIPFAILFGIIISILSYIGNIVASIFVGQWVIAKFDKRKNIAVALLIGLVIVGIVEFIPIIGGLFTLLVAAGGFGAVLFMEKEYYTELRSRKII